MWASLEKSLPIKVGNTWEKAARWRLIRRKRNTAKAVNSGSPQTGSLESARDASVGTQAGHISYRLLHHKAPCFARTIPPSFRHLRGMPLCQPSHFTPSNMCPQLPRVTSTPPGNGHFPSASASNQYTQRPHRETETAEVGGRASTLREHHQNSSQVKWRNQPISNFKNKHNRIIPIIM